MTDNMFSKMDPRPTDVAAEELPADVQLEDVRKAEKLEKLRRKIAKKQEKELLGMGRGVETALTLFRFPLNPRALCGFEVLAFNMCLVSTSCKLIQSLMRVPPGGRY